jgi:hypothetical protein
MPDRIVSRMVSVSPGHVSPDKTLRSLLFSPGVLVVAGLGAVWILCAVSYEALGYDVLTDSDSLAYYRASLKLDRYWPIELPGYPALVAAVRHLLPNLSARLSMQMLAFVAYLVGSGAIFRLLTACELSTAVPATLLIGMFPLVGTAMNVLPRVNALLYASVAVTLVCYVKGHRWALAASLAAMLFTHKSAWPLAGLLALTAVPDRRLAWWMLPLIGAPLAVYWGMGARHYDEPSWLLMDSVFGKFRADGALSVPLFGGLVNTLYSGDAIDWIKAGLVIAQLALAVFLLFQRDWLEHKWLLGLIVSPIIWTALLNRREFFSAYVYSNMIAIPLLIYLERWQVDWPKRRLWWLGVLGLSCASQFGWVAYMARYG